MILNQGCDNGPGVVSGGRRWVLRGWSGRVGCVLGGDGEGV